jgi:hypothetical protein
MRAMDVDPNVVRVHDQRLAGVDAHADAYRDAVRPAVLGERLLNLGGGGDGIASVGERDEEAVALRVDDAAAVLVARLAHEPPVPGQNLCVAVTELVQQARRALDVGEEKGDRAGREFAHCLNNVAPAREMEAILLSPNCQPAVRSERQAAARCASNVRSL